MDEGTSTTTEIMRQGADVAPLPALEQVRQWNRHDLGVLVQSMDNDAELAESFRRWRKARRGERARWLRGGTRPSATGR